MKKVIRDGKVAVLYSPGYGAGWSTWSLPEEAVFDPELVEAVLAGDRPRAADIAERKWPDAYLGGLAQLEVAWVDEGEKFQIHEYDGNESIVLCRDMEWLTA